MGLWAFSYKLYPQATLSFLSVFFLEPGTGQKRPMKVETQKSEGIPGKKSGRGTAIKGRAPQASEWSKEVGGH